MGGGDLLRRMLALAQTTLLLASSRTQSLINFFTDLGAVGPFLLETLDSSFLYLPLANELLLAALLSRGGTGLRWLVYAASGAAGTVVGVFLLDLLARRAGEAGLRRFAEPSRVRWLKSRLEKHAAAALFVAAALPPPFPFRLTVLTASALQTPRRQMLFAIFCGRLLRFATEALLILRFGQRLFALMESDVFAYAVWALTFTAAVGSFLSIRKLFFGRAARA